MLGDDTDPGAKVSYETSWALGCWETVQNVRTSDGAIAESRRRGRAKDRDGSHPRGSGSSSVTILIFRRMHGVLNIDGNKN